VGASTEINFYFYFFIFFFFGTQILELKVFDCNVCYAVLWILKPIRMCGLRPPKDLIEPTS